MLLRSINHPETVTNILYFILFFFKSEVQKYQNEKKSLQGRTHKELLQSLKERKEKDLFHCKFNSFTSKGFIFTFYVHFFKIA